MHDRKGAAGPAFNAMATQEVHDNRNAARINREPNVRSFLDPVADPAATSAASSRRGSAASAADSAAAGTMRSTGGRVMQWQGFDPAAAVGTYKTTRQEQQTNRFQNETQSFYRS